MFVPGCVSNRRRHTKPPPNCVQKSVPAQTTLWILFSTSYNEIVMRTSLERMGDCFWLEQTTYWQNCQSTSNRQQFLNVWHVDDCRSTEHFFNRLGRSLNRRPHSEESRCIQNNWLNESCYINGQFNCHIHWTTSNSSQRQECVITHIIHTNQRQRKNFVFENCDHRITHTWKKFELLDRCPPRREWDKQLPGLHDPVPESWWHHPQFSEWSQVAKLHHNETTNRLSVEYFFSKLNWGTSFLWQSKRTRLTWKWNGSKIKICDGRSHFITKIQSNTTLTLTVPNIRERERDTNQSNS